MFALIFVFMFLHRVSTYDKAIVVGLDDEGNNIYHMRHEYTDTLENIYYNEFLMSSDYADYLELPGSVSIGLTKFMEGALRCKCITAPRMRVCADEIEVDFYEVLYCLKNIKRTVNAKACKCPYCLSRPTGRGTEIEINSNLLLSLSVHNNNRLLFIYVIDPDNPLSSPVAYLRHIVQCPKIPFPVSTNEFDESVYQKDCCHGECDACNEFLESDECVLQCPRLFHSTLKYTWKEFQDHKQDKEGSCTLREIVFVRERTVAEFKESFIRKMRKFMAHYHRYKWLYLSRNYDIATLKNDWMYIVADFSANPEFEPQDKLNCQGHGVCVLCCLVVLHSPELIKYLDNDEEVQTYKYYHCDHIRVVSPASGHGKDQDWYLHTRIMDYVMKHYRNKVPELSNIILWTDGTPVQYKCRQNFMFVADFYRNYGVVLHHKFGATAQFKGVCA